MVNARHLPKLRSWLVAARAGLRAAHDAYDAGQADLRPYYRARVARLTKLINALEA